MASMLFRWHGPDTKFLFVSRYAGKMVLDHQVVDLETNLLQKTYTLKQHSFKIGSALSQSSKAANGRT